MIRGTPAIAIPVTAILVRLYFAGIRVQSPCGEELQRGTMQAIP
jgi:hypothetical protein